MQSKGGVGLVGEWVRQQQQQQLQRHTAEIESTRVNSYHQQAPVLVGLVVYTDVAAAAAAAATTHTRRARHSKIRDRKIFQKQYVKMRSSWQARAHAKKYRLLCLGLFAI